MEKYSETLLSIDSPLTKKEIINLIVDNFDETLSNNEFNKLIKFCLNENILVKKQVAKGKSIKYISSSFDKSIENDEVKISFNKKKLFDNIITIDSIKEIELKKLYEKF